MSGGVDSSVTAALLKNDGWDVVGITLQLYKNDQVIGRCCSSKDIYDARRVADHLKIPHYVIDYENTFRQDVIEQFIDSYLAGETPIPCILCNQTVKFRDLFGIAHDLDAEALATGHYVRCEKVEGVTRMLRGVDHERDQSYFLFTTIREKLNFLRFPLGDIKSKNETRKIAKQYKLPVATKPDSQDICFVPDGNYASLIELLRPNSIKSGNIVHVDGRILGCHNGIIHYTVGQRKGLGLGGGEPLYVIQIDAIMHRVIVGPKEILIRAGVTLSGVNWLVEETSGINRVQVKIRSASEPIPATLHQDDNGIFNVIFDRPKEGVTPGQACVFYDGELVLGGGWIKQAVNN
jgi:tRNA-specific 2-thiouridylase